MIIKNERRGYASDLTDKQWELIEPLFPPAGNKSKWEKRELANTVLYLVDNGCKWRNPPPDFPPHTMGYRKTFEQDVADVLGRTVNISARIRPE